MDFTDEIPNFITKYEPKFLSLQKTCNLDLPFTNLILITKSYTVYLIQCPNIIHAKVIL